MKSTLREYRFLGLTQSLCPECLAVVPAKIVSREGRVFFRKHCGRHGTRDDFVCSDDRWFDRMQYSLPGRVPRRFAIQPDRGCPFDCGLCTEHEQHTCVAVFEITSSCNLTCPLCYAGSAPGGVHLDYEACCRAIDRLVQYEGRPEVLQLSGGEPTVHPEFERIFDYACDQPIDIVMINTNGIRLAGDERLLDRVARRADRCEVYLQFDGFDDASSVALRGARLVDTKLKAIESLAAAGVRVILVCTVETDVNLHQLGRIVRFGLDRPAITGVSFQPATYVGRFVPPESLQRRATFPDVIRAVTEQTAPLWQEHDFLPLPCAHPNAHTLAYAYRSEGQAVPLTRFIDIENHLDLLANGITFNRSNARELIGTFLARAACGSGGKCGCGPVELPQPPVNLFTAPSDGPQSTGAACDGGLPAETRWLAESFFRRAIAEDLSPADVFRITTTSFMDAYNFDLRQLIKSCVHHLLPTGHLIPFSAYNVLYRAGHVPLPPLQEPIDAQPRRFHPVSTA